MSEPEKLEKMEEAADGFGKALANDDATKTGKGFGDAVSEMGQAVADVDPAIGEALGDAVDQSTGDGVLGEMAEGAASTGGELLEGGAEMAAEVGGGAAQIAGSAIGAIGEAGGHAMEAGSDIGDGDIGGAASHIAAIPGTVAGGAVDAAGAGIEAGAGVVGEGIEALGAVAREGIEAAGEIGGAMLDLALPDDFGDDDGPDLPDDMGPEVDAANGGVELPDAGHDLDDSSELEADGPGDDSLDAFDG